MYISRSFIGTPITKSAPSAEFLTSGTQVLHLGSIARVVSDPHHIRFLKTEEETIVTDDKVKEFKVIMIRHLLDRNQKSSTNSSEVTAVIKSVLICLAYCNWQQILDQGLLDNDSEVEFMVLDNDEAVLLKTQR